MPGAKRMPIDSQEVYNKSMADFEPLKPTIVLGVVAHPDDIDICAAGSLAKYASDGAKVYIYVATNGDKGSDDEAITPDQLRETRMLEQQAAARKIGAETVFFGEFPDGMLECTSSLKRDIVRYIRKTKPDVVVTFDPTFLFSTELGIVNHTDHRTVGLAAMDAVYPLARDIKTFPELLDEGFDPHKVSTILFCNFDKANYYEDITASFAAKSEAIRAHSSQFKDPEAVIAMTEQMASKAGLAAGSPYAEGFVRLDLHR